MFELLLDTWVNNQMEIIIGYIIFLNIVLFGTLFNGSDPDDNEETHCDCSDLYSYSAWEHDYCRSHSY